MTVNSPESEGAAQGKELFTSHNIMYQGRIYSFGEEAIVTVQTSKYFSVTKNSNIAQVRTRACQCWL